MAAGGAGARVVVMGVSGCGKSTVGGPLAAVLEVPFVDGDDLHPAANLAKMAAGIPLTDEDRWPWLERVGRLLADGPAVVGCSALRRVYRDRIRSFAPDTVMVHLEVGRTELEARMRRRPGHFMPVALLDSQLRTLEPLGADEAGFTLDASGDDPASLAALAAARL